MNCSQISFQDGVSVCIILVCEFMVINTKKKKKKKGRWEVPIILTHSTPHIKLCHRLCETQLLHHSECKCSNFGTSHAEDEGMSVCCVSSASQSKTSSRLWIRTHHITAVYITAQTQNNFNFHYFIIVHSYFILLLNCKTILIKIIYFLILWSASDTFNYSCILVSKTSPQ